MNDNEIDTMVGALARVEPGEPGGRSSGAAGQALLASIVTDEPATAVAPVRVRRHRPWRLALAAVAAGVMAVGVVVGPSLLGDGRGAATSYANSAVEVRLEGKDYVARIKDPFADHEKYSAAFKAVGLHVDLRVVPVSPSAVGDMVQIGVSGGEPGMVLTTGMERDGKDCKAPEKGCALVVRVPAGSTGKAWVKLGRAARPGESYENAGSVTAKGEDLAGAKVRGRPFEAVMAEVRRRGLKTEFQLVVLQGNDQHTLKPLTAGQIGPDWTVWDAEPVRAGTVRLLVTREHLDHNPLYARDSQPRS
ncbi:hypothetical protein [Actinomadura alba]|uniref:Uncharacterized protein n=1 Tax=Actinomadura alba TaxID=406431 RepID=A0ABR7LNM4_9ACTN|nr:hypothetical protein [Actinomadura alba]MBC6466278.1 hypothetical protein [Actinomadura alba]